jgi:glycosyltransferase involved in cell wall biosynthesis
MTLDLSIILPAKNEADGLGKLLPELNVLYPESEIIVVDDGSTDETKSICSRNDVKVISHPYSLGNGAAIKSGARAACGDVFVFMDADGQHKPDDIVALLEGMEKGHDMVVGARNVSTQASLARRLANSFYNRLASFMTGYKIEDLTSGFRAVRARHFRKFLYLLPNGFSYPTTSTMAFFRAGLPVAYVPIEAGKRIGKSHISLFRDGLRFFVIILKIGALFSPMRFFLPISSSIFLTGLLYYSYTYITMNRFTNMSAVLFISALLIFLMGIISEQISSLHYKDIEGTQRRVDRGE